MRSITSMRRQPDGIVLTMMCAGVLAGGVSCASSPASFTAPPAGPPAPLPSALPATDTSFALPITKEEVSLELHPRVEFRESLAETSDERSALAATVLLTLPKNRTALRSADVSLAVKLHGSSQVAETKAVSYTRETRDEVISVPLGPLGDGTYDLDVRTVAHVDVLDEDWSVMTDTREATEHAPFVVSAVAHEQTKTFEFHFDSDLAVPTSADRNKLDREVKAIGALLAAHPTATARVDCWTSSSGDVELNRALAQRRCDWFKTNVWTRLSATTKDPLAAVPHGSNELAVTERSRDVKVQSRNRLVRLRVRWGSSGETPKPGAQ